MLKRSGVVVLGLVLAAGLAGADGGKVKWVDCKNDQEYLRISAECRQFGQAMMILFTKDS